MTTITREQTQKIIEAADEVISALAGTNEDVHPGSDNMLRLWDDLNDRYAPPEVVRELARIALASLEAKPIGAFHIAEQQVDGTSDYIKDGEWPIDNGIIDVYAAPPVPVVPEEKPMPNPLSMYAVDAVAAIAEVRGWNACRAAMLQGKSEQPQNAQQNIPENIPGGNSPVTPDGWVMVPKRLTAENGAKGALSGEFSETTFISCPECFGDDDCDTCDGSGRIEIKVPVTWTTIKSIWDKGIAYFAAEPPQEVNLG